MTMPASHTANSILTTESRALTCGEFRHRGWIPARPVAYSSNPVRNLFTRLRLAYHVFTGRYDALDWQEEQTKASKGPFRRTYQWGGRND